MTRDARRVRAALLAAALGAGLAGCNPAYTCDERPDSEACRPLLLGCAPGSAAGESPRINLAQPFSLYARDLRKDVLAKNRPTAEIMLSFRDTSPVPPEGALRFSATVLEPTNDDELHLDLTAEAKQKLRAGRGGRADITVKVGRWTGALAADQQSVGCSFVIEPVFETGVGAHVTTQLRGLPTKDKDSAAQLFVGRRVDCAMGDANCAKYGPTLYANYYAKEAATDYLQLERFTLDTAAKLLKDEPALTVKFQQLAQTDRPVGSYLVMSGSSLLLRASPSKLLAMKAQDLGLQGSALPLANDSLAGAFAQERFFLVQMANLRAYSLSPTGAATQSGATTLTTNASGMTWRVLPSMPSPWLTSAAPEALAMNERGEVRFVCENPELACQDPVPLQEAAQKLWEQESFRPTGASIQDLDPVLADLDTDGVLDLVVLNRKSKRIYFMPQRRGGKFDAPRALSVLPDADRFAVADLDGDGLQDLVLLSMSSVPPALSVFLNRALSQ